MEPSRGGEGLMQNITAIVAPALDFDKVVVPGSNFLENVTYAQIDACMHVLSNYKLVVQTLVQDNEIGIKKLILDDLIKTGRKEEQARMEMFLTRIKEEPKITKTQ